MTAHTKQLVLAAVIAPWAVVGVASLWSAWYFFTATRSTPEHLVFPDPDRPWEFVLLFSMYGVPTAYLTLLVLLPLYVVARHFGVVSYLTMGGAGLIMCVPAALYYGRPSYVFWTTLTFLLPFGIAVGICFLWIIRRGSGRCVGTRP